MMEEMTYGRTYETMYAKCPHCKSLVSLGGFCTHHPGRPLPKERKVTCTKCDRFFNVHFRREVSTVVVSC